MFLLHIRYFQERTEELPGESKKYTRLMSHSTASIASILNSTSPVEKKLSWNERAWKKMQEIAITNLNAPNGSRDIPFQSREFEQDGCRYFVDSSLVFTLIWRHRRSPARH